MTAIEIYRRISRNACYSSDQAALAKWSFNIAYLTCVAITTTLVCYVDLLTGGF